MKTILIASFMASAQIFPAALAADLPLEGVVEGGDALVAEVIDGETVLLDDGREVRLLGILAPPSPFAETARNLLSDLTRGRRVSLYYDGERSDRYGRLLVHMTLIDGLWVQGALLDAGMARVMTRRENRSASDALYGAEALAREESLGLWASADNRPRCAGRVDAADETFQIVWGRVADAADVRGVIYINFGADYRSDFTARVEKRHRRRFRASSGQMENWTAEWEADPKKLNGKIVEVRGWVFPENGPMIDLNHPEQLRIIEPEPGQKGPACFD